jgi:hypothetical protein
MICTLIRHHTGSEQSKRNEKESRETPDVSGHLDTFVIHPDLREGVLNRV